MNRIDLRVNDADGFLNFVCIHKAQAERRAADVHSGSKPPKTRG
jgi:hypothetical protein